MARREAELRLPVPRDRAEQVCTETLQGLGWDVTPLPGGIRADEEAARLHCHCPAATANLAIDEAAPGASSLRVEVEVPGFGPISGKHAAEQADLLARHVGLAAIRASR